MAPIEIIAPYDNVKNVLNVQGAFVNVPVVEIILDTAFSLVSTNPCRHTIGSQKKARSRVVMSGASISVLRVFLSNKLHIAKDRRSIMK